MVFSVGYSYSHHVGGVFCVLLSLGFGYHLVHLRSFQHRTRHTAALCCSSRTFGAGVFGLGSVICRLSFQFSLVRCGMV
ncbi:hypothetical protein [Pseudomonas phage PIP]|nr:hypothetical protein [Pseudomonas phage PIP]